MTRGKASNLLVEKARAEGNCHEVSAQEKTIAGHEVQRIRDKRKTADKEQRGFFWLEAFAETKNQLEITIDVKNQHPEHVH
ncbi:hypothetical protein R1flu_004016 [Riccia fluitans]|uniref:Uncharacterized protein n=1 Tax=Riccia fluitans TaxID=41844 RepID=A0ABD1YP39_9MARC